MDAPNQVQALILAFSYLVNNVPGESLHEKMQNASIMMENNGSPLTIYSAQVIDGDMVGNCGNSWWAEYSLAPEGTRFNRADGSIVEIVLTYGLTCDVVALVANNE